MFAKSASVATRAPTTVTVGQGNRREDPCPAGKAPVGAELSVVLLCIWG